MKPRLPATWIFDVHGPFKHASSQTHNGIFLEVYAVANYFRAGLQVDDATSRPGLPKGRWAAGVWAHSDSETEAISIVEKLAIDAGLVERRDVSGT